MSSTSSELTDANVNALMKAQLESLRTKYNIPGLAAALVDNGETIGIAVAGVRREGHPELVALNDSFMLKSCTKPMTGMLLASLIEDGWLTWDTKITDIFPEVPIFSLYLDMTVADLMAHETGMPPEPYGEPSDNYASLGPSLPTRRYAYVQEALDDPSASLPPNYTYSGGSIIVAAMAERLTGQSWETLITNRVWTPLGMSTAGMGESAPNPFTVASHERINDINVPWTPPAGYSTEAHAPAGRNTHTNIVDFAKFVAGNLPFATKGTRIVETATLTQMHMKMMFSGFTKGGFFKGPSPWGGNYEVLSHNGKDGKDYSYMAFSPWENFGLAVMTNVQDDRAANDLATEIPAIRRHLVAAKQFSADHIPVTAAYASNVYEDAPQYAATKAFDGMFSSRWATDNGTVTASLTALFGGTHSFSKIVITEEYANRVTGFRIERWNGSNWATAHTGTTIGSDRVIQLRGPITASAARLVITAATGPVTISEVWFSL